jgi:hypothetical protein
MQQYTAEQWILKGMRQGTHSVKSAYYLYLNYFTPAAELAVPGDWNLLWSLQIPRKTKPFLWRLWYSILPTRIRLHSSGVSDYTVVDFPTNMVAHHLARAFISYASPHLFYDPHVMSDSLLMNDKS